jgi:rod shape-determining protein MreD
MIEIEVTPQLIVRVALLVVVTVLMQISLVSQITIFGSNADLSPLLVASLAQLTGSIPGALVGFGVGLFVDMALVQTLGVTALVLTVVGYGVGRLRELRYPEGALTPLAVGAAATALATVGFSVIQFLLGVDAPVSFLLVGQIAVTILLNAVLALPFHALVRRWLSPTLPEDPRRRRRRAYTTGGLSPLSRA